MSAADLSIDIEPPLTGLVLCGRTVPLSGRVRTDRARKPVFSRASGGPESFASRNDWRDREFLPKRANG